MKCSCGCELTSYGHCPVQKYPWSDKTHPNWFLNKLDEDGIFYEYRERHNITENLRYLRGTGK